MYSKRSIETQTAVKLGSSHFNSMDRTRTALHHSHGHGHQQNHRTLNPVTALTSTLRRAFSCFSNVRLSRCQVVETFSADTRELGLSKSDASSSFHPTKLAKGWRLLCSRVICGIYESSTEVSSKSEIMHQSGTSFSLPTAGRRPTLWILKVHHYYGG